MCYMIDNQFFWRGDKHLPGRITPWSRCGYPVDYIVRSVIRPFPVDMRICGIRTFYQCHCPDYVPVLTDHKAISAFDVFGHDLFRRVAVIPLAVISAGPHNLPGAIEYLHQ